MLIFQAHTEYTSTAAKIKCHCLSCLSLPPQFSPLTTHLSPLTSHISPLISCLSSLTSDPSTLTSHRSSLTLSPLTLTPPTKFDCIPQDNENSYQAARLSKPTKSTRANRAVNTTCIPLQLAYFTMSLPTRLTISVTEKPKSIAATRTPLPFIPIIDRNPPHLTYRMCKRDIAKQTADDREK